MPRDRATTRSRVLSAAIEEFSAHGLAGGRVERIAERSGYPAGSIYQHFSSKEQLFEASVSDALDRLADRIPDPQTDLVTLSGSIFDAMLENPHAVRLHLWRMLERPTFGPTAITGLLAAAVSRDPADSPIPPGDLVMFVLSLIASWLTTSESQRVEFCRDNGTSTRLAEHRDSIVRAVALLAGTGAASGHPGENSGAGRDQPGLVGQDDGLHAITES